MSNRRSRNKPLTAPKVDVRTEAKQSQAEWEEDLKKLWKLLKNATPENKAKIMSQLDDKTVTALRTMGNPYKKPVIDDKSNRMLVFSVINLTEKYSQRFAMTSLIGFINRMLDEYKPDTPTVPKGSKEYISENAPEFATPYNEKVKAAQRRKPDATYRHELEQCKKRIEEVRTKLALPVISDDVAKKNTEVKKLEVNGSPLDEFTPGITATEQTTLQEELRKLAKDSFILRAKIAKYQLYLLHSDTKELREQHEKLTKELKARTDEEKAHVELLRVRKIKLDKRVRAEREGREALKNDLQDTMGEDMKKVEAMRAEGKRVEDLPEDEQWAIKSKLRTVLTINDMQRAVEEFEKDVNSTQADLTRVQGQIADFNAKLQKLNDEIKDLEAKTEAHMGFFKALKEEYTEKLARTKTGPTAVQKVAGHVKHHKKQEGPHPLDEVDIVKMDLTEEEFDAIAEEVKKELGVTKTAEEYTEEVQNTIRKFLDQYLVYNPDNHVRCSYKPNYEDPTRDPIDIEKERKEKEVKYERVLWPPDDTFFRWNRYIENNYEELRQATDDIYSEKSDFEFAIVPYKVFEGPDEKKVMEEVREYQRKYADEFEADILCARFFNWNLLGSWAQNREVRDFYNKNTEIIKRILDQNKEDQQMGPKLMKDRATKEKQKNIKESGPDAYGFSEIKKHSRTAAELERHGAKPIKEIETRNVIKDAGPIPASSIPRDDRESTKDEVEVGVHVVQPQLRPGKRRVRGVTESFKFNIPTEKLPEGAVQVETIYDVTKRKEREKKDGMSSLFDQ
jgi:archaellum component FlaC